MLDGCSSKGGGFSSVIDSLRLMVLVASKAEVSGTATDSVDAEGPLKIPDLGLGDRK